MIIFIMFMVFVLTYWLQPIFFSPREKYGLSIFTYFMKRVFNALIVSLLSVFLLVAFGIIA